MPDETGVYLWYRNKADGKLSTRFQMWIAEGVDNTEFDDELVVAGCGPFVPPNEEEWSEVTKKGRVGNAITQSVRYLPDFITTLTNLLQDHADITVAEDAGIEEILELADYNKVPVKAIVASGVPAFRFVPTDAAAVNRDEPRIIQMDDVTFLECVTDVNIQYHEPYATAPGCEGFSEHPNVHKGILDEEYTQEAPIPFRVPAHAVGITEINPRELDGKVCFAFPLSFFVAPTTQHTCSWLS